MLGRNYCGAWRAAGHSLASSAHAPFARAATPGRARAISTLTSLERLPQRILRVPLFDVGRSGLARLGVPGHKLLASAASFRDSVAELNRQIGPDPHCIARSGLTPDEILGVALGIVQAARQVREEADSPEVLSLVYHLLSALPMERRVGDALERHAQSVVDAVVQDWIAMSDASRWWSQTPSDRERALVRLADRMPVLPCEARLAAGAESRMRLHFERRDPLSAAMKPCVDLDVGQVMLSEALLARDPPLQADLALLMVPSLLAHEIFHIEQYGALHLLDSLTPQPREDMATAVRYGLSIGVQEDIWERGYSVELTPFLPHEQESWALASLVLRAMIRHPDVPPEAAERLRARLIDTYPRYAHLLGDRFAPWARAADGVLWAGGESHLALQDMAPDEVAKRVAVFIEEPPKAQA